ncbi:hypothetical protein Tco_1213040 [Tanacetum coccineum]
MTETKKDDHGKAPGKKSWGKRDRFSFIRSQTMGFCRILRSVLRRFLSQKRNEARVFKSEGSRVGMGVKEKQVSIADKSIEVSKHANVVNICLDSFPTISDVHGTQSPDCYEENMNDAGTEVGSTLASNTPGMSSYVNVTGGLSRKAMDFHTLFTPGGNEVDVVVPVEFIRAISERFVNTEYGF